MPPNEPTRPVTGLTGGNVTVRPLAAVDAVAPTVDTVWPTFSCTTGVSTLLSWSVPVRLASWGRRR